MAVGLITIALEISSSSSSFFFFLFLFLFLFFFFFFFFFLVHLWYELKLPEGATVMENEPAGTFKKLK